jgi:hypothetical protein
MGHLENRCEVKTRAARHGRQAPPRSSEDRREGRILLLRTSAAEQKAWKASGPDRGVAGIRDESGDVIGVLVDSGEFAFEAKGTWSADGVNFRLTVDLAAGRSE